MGGCRCTYRNCTVKTDGKTHMFHYPVFEKVRCHQWLVNAQRLEFLDLKVSQLKNRVVCQHHFREENFMNYKKDKLTFDAIPTENGPFCDPSKFVVESQEKSKSYPNLILLEDIENEVIFNDKKANFSLKYADFLINGEAMDTSSRYNLDDIDLSKENAKRISKPKGLLNPTKGVLKGKDLKKQEIFKPCFTRLSLPSKDDNKMQPQPMLVVPPYTDLSVEMGNNNDFNQKNISIYAPHLSNYKNQTMSIQNGNNFAIAQSNNNTQQNNNKSLIAKEASKIKILSEKKIQIQNPIPVMGKLEKVSPSITLNLPDKSKEEILNVRNLMQTITDANPPEKFKVLEILDVEYNANQPQNEAPPPPSEISKPKISTKANNIVHAAACQASSKSSQIKSKITSERSAAIEKKRKFNMRMKDILETCLDKLDDSIKVEEKSPSQIKMSRKSLLKQPVPKETDTQVSADQNMSNSEKYTIAYLDARMKSMEKALLSKIEQNSQRILELKDTFVNVNVKKNKDTNEKKYICAETNTNEDCYKKFLYKEISQYLSPDSNSLIYEELFINKYAVVQTSPQRKRRRKYI